MAGFVLFAIAVAGWVLIIRTLESPPGDASLLAEVLEDVAERIFESDDD